MEGWPHQPEEAKDRRDATRIDPIRAAHHDAIFILARASELHDEDTGAHLMRIRHIVELIALRMGFDPDDAETLGYDAMLHDVGKLNISVRVLKKPDYLTDDERDMMQAHPIRGERLLSSRPSMQRAAVIARSHHEAWDGSGYPDGLAGEQIPLEARITAAADVLDALLHDRCYKQSWSYERAVNEIFALSGTKLDPRVVDAMRQCNSDGSLAIIFGRAPQCVDPAVDEPRREAS
jgi:putative two-component system response regulator